MTQFQKAIPLNITGGSYESRTRPLSSQRTLNWYPMVVEAGKDQFVLHSYPGLRLISQSGSTDRGMTVMAETLYRVSGTTLYSVNSAGVHTALGTISGTSRCIFANDGVNLVIVANGTVYNYNGTLTTITDIDIIGSTAVTYLNNQFIYTNNGLFVASDVGDPTTANGLNPAGAESQPDDLLRAYSFQQTTYMIGTRSAEPWWNTGTGFPPFSRMDGQIIEVGCKAIHSIANTDEFLYWLGDDNAIYQVSGGQKRRVSSPAITHAIEGFSSASDAVGYTLTFEGINFYVIHFPTGNKTFALNEMLGDKGWFELASGDNQYQGTSLVSVYGKNYVADKDNGNLYQLDINTYINNSDSIKRQRVTSSVNSNLFGVKGQRVQMSRLEIIMESGVGLISGQGENPKIIIDVSYDGGKSWVSKGFVSTGRLGENVLKVELYSLDSFYDAIFRISATDPIPYELYSAAIDLRLAGW